MRGELVRRAVTWLRRLRLSTWVLWGAVALLVGGLLASVPVSWKSLGAGLGRTVMATGVAGVTVIAGTVLLVAAATPRVVVRVRRRSRAVGRQGSVRPMPMWAIWLGLGVVVLVGGVAAWVLVSTFGSGSPQDKIRLEAIKLAGTIAVGTGGVAALLLTARRQRTTELDLVQKGHDADERRVTELYTAAAQQLASDKAPVRLAGLYALSRLGQTAPDHRQTIINLFCAYLRMPDSSSPGEPDKAKQSDNCSEPTQQDAAAQPLLIDLAPTLAEAAGLSLDAAEQQQQERQVRLTAQRLLTQHLRSDPDDQGRSTNPDFWGSRDGMGLDLDLTNATLYDWDFRGCQVRHADFTNARFCGMSLFQAQFHGSVRFVRAQFRGEALFFEAEFYDHVWFFKAVFHANARFFDACFYRNASFVGTHFWEGAWFEGAQFCERALFNDAQFHGAVDVERMLVRLDHGSRLQTTPPKGWTLDKVDPADGRAGQWAKFVPEKDEAVGEAPPTSSAAAGDDVGE